MDIFNDSSAKDICSKNDFLDKIETVLEDALACSKSNESLTEELRSVLNRHGVDSRSSTPDFILAELIMSVLDAFAKAVKRTEEWEKE